MATVLRPIFCYTFTLGSEAISDLGFCNGKETQTVPLKKLKQLTAENSLLVSEFSALVAQLPATCESVTLLRFSGNKCKILNYLYTWGGEQYKVTR